jgi:hypothetical protein
MKETKYKLANSSHYASVKTINKSNLSTIQPDQRRSLNTLTRKKEFERIERENQGIAQRLYGNASFISKKSLDFEFK